MGFEFTWQTGVSALANFFTAKATLTAIDSIADTDVGKLVGFAGKSLGLGGGPQKVVLYHYEQINDSVSAEYADVTIRGRSQPFVHYVHTGTNKISFEGKLVAGADSLGLKSANAVWQDALMLKSWMYPSYVDGRVKPPPLLQLDVGTTYQGVKGIIRSLDLTEERPWTLDHLPYVVTVNIEFEILYSTPVDRDHVREGMRDSSQNVRGRIGYFGEKLGGLYRSGKSILNKDSANDVWGNVKERDTAIKEKAKNGWDANYAKNPAKEE